MGGSDLVCSFKTSPGDSSQGLSWVQLRGIGKKRGGRAIASFLLRTLLAKRPEDREGAALSNRGAEGRPGL